MRYVLIALPLVAIAAGFSWWRGHDGLIEGVRAVEAKIREIGIERDGSPPSEASVRERIEAWSRDEGLRLANLEVSVRRGALSTPAIVARGAEQAAEKLGASLTRLAGFGVTINVRGQLSGRRGLASVTRSLDLLVRIIGDVTPRPDNRDPVGRFE